VPPTRALVRSWSKPWARSTRWICRPGRRPSRRTGSEGARRRRRRRRFPGVAAGAIPPTTKATTTTLSKRKSSTRRRIDDPNSFYSAKAALALAPQTTSVAPFACGGLKVPYRYTHARNGLQRVNEERRYMIGLDLTQ